MLCAVMIGNELREFVKRRRESLRLSQVELAQEAGPGLSASTVARLETGELMNPTTETIIALAKGLRVTPEAVFQAAAGLKAEIEGAPSLRALFAEAKELPEEDWPDILEELHELGGVLIQIRLKRKK